MNVPANQQLRERIEAFVVHVNQIIHDNTTKNYTSLTPETVRAEYISDKWCKIVRQSRGGGGDSVYAFIALEAFSTKTLGQITVGDIHKPAGWKAPAKHKRGSVFSEDFDKCAGPYGVAYLR